MKRRLLLLLLVLLLLSPAAYAHPGRTDSNGGHTDAATGEYHYHHGYPAHQHYDIDGDGTPDCPYLFKTAAKSTTATTSAATSSTASSLKVQTAKSASASVDTDTMIFFLIFIFLAFAVCFFLLRRQMAETEKVNSALYSATQKNKSLESALAQVQAEQEARYNEKQFQLHEEFEALYFQEREKLEAAHAKALEELNAAHAQELAAAQKQIEKLTLDLRWSERRRKYVYDAMVRGYGENFLLRAAGAPPDLFWDSKGFPHLSPEIGLDPYTLHRSSTGKFHRPECPHSYRCTAVNALQVSREEFQRNRCQVCQPVYPDLSWADELNNLLEYTKF